MSLGHLHEIPTIAGVPHESVAAEQTVLLVPPVPPSLLIVMPIMQETRSSWPAAWFTGS